MMTIIENEIYGKSKMAPKLSTLKPMRVRKILAAKTVENITFK